jgi:uncharacterized protein (TIGR04255 family)
MFYNIFSDLHLNDAHYMVTELRGFPKKISPCPIVEAIAELRFTSAVLPDAIFGIIYQEFKDEFPERVENLPILQLPEPIRSMDPGLRYQPYYKLASSNLIFQVGPRVTSLSNVKEYMGWENFSRRLKEVFSKLEKLKIIKSVERLGIRYINFFKLDIYDNINLRIIMNEEPLRTLNMTLRTEIEEDNFINLLQIANKAQVRIQNQSLSGSVIDIDTGSKTIGETFFEEMENLLEKGHHTEKKLFFSLLKKEFLSSLNPEY